MHEMKIVGKRKAPKRDLVYAANLLDLVIDLRKGKPLIPKGVHRFSTFEESRLWTLKMMTRSSSRERRE
jgi:hypothetical protein